MCTKQFHILYSLCEVYVDVAFVMMIAKFWISAATAECRLTDGKLISSMFFVLSISCCCSCRCIVRLPTDICAVCVRARGTHFARTSACLKLRCFTRLLVIFLRYPTTAKHSNRTGGGYYNCVGIVDIVHSIQMCHQTATDHSGWEKEATANGQMANARRPFRVWRRECLLWHFDDGIFHSFLWRWSDAKACSVSFLRRLSLVDNFTSAFERWLAIPGREQVADGKRTIIISINMLLKCISEVLRKWIWQSQHFAMLLQPESHIPFTYSEHAQLMPRKKPEHIRTGIILTQPCTQPGERVRCCQYQHEGWQKLPTQKQIHPMAEWHRKPRNDW